MKKRLYRKILKKLLSFFGKNLKGHSLRRIKSFAAFICGILRKKKPHMSAMGSGLPQLITAHSKEKAAKKFLENYFIDFETYYLPYINSLLEQIIAVMPKNEAIKLVIDGSKMGNAHMALMVSIIYKGRGIPIMWFVEKKPKGHFTAQTHVELISQVHKMIDTLSLEITRPIILLGDGEFDSIELQQFCRSKAWGYVFRTACNTVFYQGQTRFQPKDIKADGRLFKSYPNVKFTTKQFKNVHFVFWHDPKYDAPLPLVSNLGNPEEIIKLYDQRYSIEGMFKDFKSTTFNIHKTRLADSRSIANLIMIAAFAFTLLVKIGVKYQNSPHRKYIHRLRPDRTVNTIITFARDFIDYCLDEGLDFSFSFQFSMNSA